MHFQPYSGKIGVAVAKRGRDQNNTNKRGTGVIMGVLRLISLALLFLAGTVMGADDSDAIFVGLKGNPKLKSASAIVLDQQGNLIYG